MALPIPFSYPNYCLRFQVATIAGFNDRVFAFCSAHYSSLQRPTSYNLLASVEAKSMTVIRWCFIFIVVNSASLRDG